MYAQDGDIMKKLLDYIQGCILGCLIKTRIKFDDYKICLEVSKIAKKIKVLEYKIFDMVKCIKKTSDF